MDTPKPNEQDSSFDPHVLRLFIGCIAIGLPTATMLFSSTPLSSISASYYTESRDIFVGALSIIGALFWAFSAEGPRDKMVSTVGAIAAFSAALFPTACEGCVAGAKSIMHYLAAAVLFLAAAYLCFFVFSSRARQKVEKDRLGPKRASFYMVCGWIILACIAGALIAQLTLPAEIRTKAAITFYAELVALWAFGAAWLVASKLIWWLVADQDERLILFSPRPKQDAQELQAQA